MVVVSTKGVSTGFEPVPAGVYNVTASAKKSGPSKTSGKPSFSVELTVNSPEEYAGKKLFYNGSLQVQALFGFKRVLVAFGAPEEYIEGEAVDSDVALDSIIGKTADVKATLTEDGKRNNIDVILEGENTGTQSGW